MTAYRLAVLGLIAVAVGCTRESVPEARDTLAATSMQGQSAPAPFTLTPRAAQAVRDIAAHESAPDKLYLRVRMVYGGCTGFQHKLDLEPDVSPVTDLTFIVQGVRVVIWKRQEEMLRGVVVDYLDEPERRGFSVKQPVCDTPTGRKFMVSLARDFAQDNPNNANSHYVFGKYLAEDAQYAAAVPAFERALELEPNMGVACEELGKCLLNLQQKERGLAMLCKAWKLADGDEDAQQTRVRIGRLLTEQGAALPQAVKTPQRQ